MRFGFILLFKKLFPLRHIGKVIKIFYNFFLLYLIFLIIYLDPFNIPFYLNNSMFLPYINNEVEEKNTTYSDHISSLNHWNLVYSTTDNVVVPKEVKSENIHYENSRALASEFLKAKIFTTSEARR